MNYSIFPELRIFENMKKNDNFFHAFLFYGNTKTDVFSSAVEALKIIISNDKEKYEDVYRIEDLNYVDLVFIKPEKNLISKTEIISATLKKMLETSLVKNKYKILFIQDVDLASLHSLNALLKFIEEPNKDTIIIMTTNKIDKIIPTIKSRTQNIFIKPKTNQILINILKKEKKYSGFEEILVAIFGNNNKKIEENFQNFQTDFYDFINELDKIKINSVNLRILLHLKLNKKNYENIINIIEYLLSSIIKKHLTIFENHKNIVEGFMALNFDFEKILLSINSFKNAVKSYGNFSLHKEKFLIELEESINV